jgi:predicted nucleotidyltransferase
MIDNKEIVNELVRRIVTAAHPVRIILFGSFARGDQDHNSDIDALVVMPDGSACRKTAKQIYAHLSGFGFAADIVVATPSILERHKDNPSLVYFQALREGKELYSAAA